MRFERRLLLALAVTLTTAFIASAQQFSDFNIGVGIYDITGPAAEVGLMGYSDQDRTAEGIHFRLYARAYVIALHANPSQRVVFVNLDTCIADWSVKATTIEKLQKLYGNLYTHSNVMLSASHTHSGPGGYSWYSIYDVETYGFLAESFDAIANGVVEAITRAHQNMTSGGRILINRGELSGSSVNRSPTAYALNHDASQYATNVDESFVLLRLQDQTGVDLGVITWFAVQGTSMNKSNHLISGDNKGMAAYLFEKHVNGPNSVAGQGPWIASFAQSNDGDVSPNTKGASCPDGSPCDPVHSTCNGRVEDCTGKGPGVDILDSTSIIANNQFQEALSLFNNATTRLMPFVNFIYTTVNMENVTVAANFTNSGKVETTCIGALGDSFAAGTTDGPGFGKFEQGENITNGNTFWNAIAHLLSFPTLNQFECQYPKPIFLNTGGMKQPAQWTPHVLPMQIFQLGQLYIIGAPAQLTTMAGRRLRATVSGALATYGAFNSSSFVVISGSANSYSQSVATYEEYQEQRYEGATTLYGPNTLAAYQSVYHTLAADLATGISNIVAGPQPPASLGNATVSFFPGVIEDRHPADSKFGQVLLPPNATYNIGDTVSVVFQSGNPRNNLMTGKTFLAVQFESSSNQWNEVRTDGDIDTFFIWARTGLGESQATVQWVIPKGTPTGTYRIRHFGYYKKLLVGSIPYIGTSSSFTVN